MRSFPQKGRRKMTHYDGPERRVHTIFRTLNHEYHVRAGICVAVRDRATQIWISNHEAVGTTLDINLPGEFYVGRPLVLSSPYCRIRTSKVLSFERPERDTVDAYGLVWAVCPS
jgi:hypothetical protein